MVKIYESNQLSREALESVLQRFEWSEGCSIERGEDTGVMIVSSAEGATKENDLFNKPVRLGAVLDRMQRHLSGKAANTTESIEIGPYILDLSGNDLLEAETGEKIRLTDKEKHILQYLHENADQVVERSVLLEEVWEYAENVETHTLETHIYRLRQKIEKDPANPAFLVTKDQGYTLGN